MLSVLKRHKYRAGLVLLFITGVVLYGFLTFINKRLVGSDDTVFQTQILPYHNVIDWVVYRYHSWSGRIFSEGIVYTFSSLPLYFWQIANTFMYALFVALFFAYYKIFNDTRSPKKDFVMLAAALCLPFLADKDVLSSGAIWVTGSMVYLWITVFALMAFYPVVYYVINKQRPHWLIASLAVPCMVIATSSQEQVGAVLLSLSTIFGVFYYIKYRGSENKKIPWYLIFATVIIALSFFFSITAPGNGVRIKSELATWLPDFYTVPLVDRLQYSYRWMLEAFINHSGLLLVSSWVLMVALFLRKKVKDKFDYIFIVILLLAALFLLGKGFESSSYWVDFYATWKPAIANKLSAINLIPWGVVMISTILAPMVLWRRNSKGYLISLLYLASIASAGLMLLSPTLYASEWRSFFVPSVILMFIVYVLLNDTFNNYTQRYIVMTIVIGFAFSHYFYQIAHIIHNFYS